MARRKSNLAEITQTELVGSMPLKSLAKVLAGKGRRGDTILAHITPKEAKKLKKDGGAGTINPETGLPEFFGEDGFDYPTFEAPTVDTTATQAPIDFAAGSQPVNQEVMSQFQSPQTTADYFSGYNPAADLPSYGAQEAGLSNYVSGLFGGGQQAGTLTSASGAPLPTPRGMTPEDASSYYSQGATPEDPGVQTQIQPTSEDVAKAQGGDSSGLLGKMGLSDLLKLGVGGIGALMGRSQQQAAIKQAAAAAQQYKDAAAAASQQYKDLAQPLLGPGYTALSQANQGTLSAANRQAFDVARARAAQASARSGGVGAVQTAMEEGRMYQQMVSTQLQQAMQLIAPGNSLASAAISTTLAGQQGALGLQLQLEQQANQAATNMYSALAKMVA